MSVNSEISEPCNDVIYANFNQTSNALSVGTKRGFKLYKLDDQGRFQIDYEYDQQEEVRLIERHYLSSLIAFVRTSSPRKLIFYNFNNKVEIGIKHFMNTIHSIKLNRKIFVVCLEDGLHIFDMMLMRWTYTIPIMPSTPIGVCALTSNNGDSLIAYPGSNTVGDIQIFDADKLACKNVIPAHNNPIACVAFNDDGTQIASASTRGTVIRIFSVCDGSNLFEFRRGRREVDIYSLSFSSGSDFLCASSNTETVHIFKLVKEAEEENDVPPVDLAEEGEGWLAAVGKIMSYSAKYLPTQISDVFSQPRSFSTIHLPFCGVQNTSCVYRYRNRKTFHIFVVSLEGILYTYSLNMEGGSCTMVRQHRLDCNFSPRSGSDSRDVTKISRPYPFEENVSGSPSHTKSTDPAYRDGASEKDAMKESLGEVSDMPPPLTFSVT